MKKRNIRKRNIGLNRKATTVSLVIIFALLFISVLVGALLARYIAVNREKAEIISASFHISSNYLKEDGGSYTVTDWGYHNDYDIIFEIYNYETDNVALITADPIAYKISAPAGWTVTVKEKNGDEVSPVNSVYTLPANGVKHTHVVTLKREGTRENTAEVSVTTTAPYTTTLLARFVLDETHDLSYEILDRTSYVSVVINTNNYAGYLNVEWTDDFSPDNTNSDMKTWTNTAKTGKFTVNEHTVYELIFLKNTTDTYTQGITVSVEGGE